MCSICGLGLFHMNKVWDFSDIDTQDWVRSLIHAALQKSVDTTAQRHTANEAFNDNSSLLV